MNLISDSGDRLVITLSRRNLETLIKCLDYKVGMPAIHRMVADGLDIVIKAEENEEHYNSEARGDKKGQTGVGPDDVEAHAAAERPSIGSDVPDGGAA